MRDGSATKATIILVDTARALVSDPPTACFALIAAALGVVEADMRGKVDDETVNILAHLLAAAGGEIMERGLGPLNLAATAGSA